MESKGVLKYVTGIGMDYLMGKDLDLDYHDVKYFVGENIQEGIVFRDGYYLFDDCDITNIASCVVESDNDFPICVCIVNCEMKNTKVIFEIRDFLKDLRNRWLNGVKPEDFRKYKKILFYIYTTTKTGDPKIIKSIAIKHMVV